MEQPASNPRFCTNNCGFYGSSQFEGMCSKCYREHVNRTNNAGRTNAFPSFYSSSQSLRSDDVEPTRNDSEEDNMMSSDSVADTSANEPSTSPDMAESSSSLLPHIASAPTLTTSRNIDIPSANDSSASSSTLDIDAPVASSLGAEKKKVNRCTWDTCNKKLGLTGFDCRCGGQFCSLHRYANEHSCTFDYKEHGQNEIRKNMPVVQAERVRRI